VRRDFRSAPGASVNTYSTAQCVVQAARRTATVLSSRRLGGEQPQRGV